MAKSLLTALSGRGRSNHAAEPSGKEKDSNSSASAAQVSRPGRRHRFDDKSGPPPPRGSLTSDKLSYLDWRLKRINLVRQKLEGTSESWIDGRDTIGRTSFDFGRPARVRQEDQTECIVPAPQAIPMMPSSIAPIYADDKVAAVKALEHAYAGYMVLASMPHLAKRDSSSSSEISASSDQHASDLPAMLHATADKDVGGVYFTKPRKSIITRAGSRFGRKKISQVPAQVNEAKLAVQDNIESRPVSRSNRSFSRIFKR
nr:putative protein [Melanopsichium pennsylvanicum 4]